MSRASFALGVAASLLACALVSAATVKRASLPPLRLRTLTYKGWEGCIALTAGSCRVVVAPGIGGRIVEYSCNGRGPIWLNPTEMGKIHPPDPGVWWNYGGYKTWPAPQSGWDWPPDFQLDAAPATVTPWTVNGKLYGLRIAGQGSEKAGVSFTKYLRLDPATGRLSLRQTMRALPGNAAPVRWGVWDITQVMADGFIAVPLNPHSPHEGGLYFYGPEAKQSRQWSVRDHILLLRNMGDTAKYGADTDGGWMAWLHGDLAYLKRFPKRIPGEEYPDQSSSAQVYTNSAALPYTEMEIAGPIQTLKPGEETSLVEEWQLVDFPKPVKTEADARAALRRLEQQGRLKPLQK